MKVKSLLTSSIVSLGVLGSFGTTAFACTTNTPAVNACAPKHAVAKFVKVAPKYRVDKIVKVAPKHRVVKFVKVAPKHRIVKVVKAAKGC